MLNRTPILLGILLVAAPSAQAKVISAPVGVHGVYNSSVVGIAAAESMARRQSGFGLLPGGMSGNLFHSVLNTPLAQAYAAAQSLKVRVFQQARVFFNTQEDVFTYRPTPDVIAAAKGLKMPRAAVDPYEDNLIGKPRQRSDFNSSPGVEDFFIASDHMDGMALKAESVRSSLVALDQRLARREGGSAPFDGSSTN